MGSDLTGVSSQIKIFGISIVAFATFEEFSFLILESYKIISMKRFYSLENSALSFAF